MKFVKWLGLAFLTLLFAIFLIGYLISEPKPVGKEGDEAKHMADCMLEAINHEAWLRTGAVSWDFAGQHKFIWDRERGYVQVEWDSYTALLRISDKAGYVYKGQAEMAKEEVAEYLEKAWAYWANDSYWLNPISKIYDEGVILKHLPESLPNEKELLVTFSTGGITPGDTYLWTVGDGCLPTSVKMWVKIIPIGGVEVTWEDWIATETGVKIATAHKLPFYTLQISNVRTDHTLVQLTNGVDIFADLEKM